MANIKILDKLSLKAQQELNKIVNNKENAVDMIINNYYKDASYTSTDVCARFCVQYFALNPNASTLQTSGKDGWWQKESYEANTVNEKLFPIVETQTTEDEWGKQYYSSFALKERDDVYKIKYPLDDDYTSSVSPFFNTEMTTENYAELVSEVQNKLGVKITEGQVASLNLYKRSLFVLATTKIKNTALKLVRKLDKVATAFKGKLILANKTTGNYKYTNIEKSVKIFDSLFKVGITKQAKYAKKATKKQINKDVQFASRLFANMLMARVTNFGDLAINQKVEKCLSLQFANVLNKNNFNSAQLKLITELASNTVVDTLKRMGYTTQTIMQKTAINGYQYLKVPTNEKEALLLAHEKDYSVYLSSVNKEINEDEFSLGLTPTQSAKNLESEIAGVKDFTKEVVNDVNNQTNERLLPAGKEQNLLPSGERPLLTDGGKQLQESNKKTAKSKRKTLQQKLLDVCKEIEQLLGFNPTQNGGESDEHSVEQEQEDTPQTQLLNAGQSQALLSAGTQQKQQLLGAKKANAGLLNKGIHGYLAEAQAVTPNYEYTPNNSRMLINVNDLPFISKKEEEEVSSKQVTLQGKKFGERAIKRYIDSVLEKVIYDMVLKVTNAANANRYSSYGGKEKAKNLVQFLSTALCFYKKSAKKYYKTTKATKENNATLYARSSQFAGVLRTIKESTTQGILKEAEQNPPKQYEKVSTYVNRLSKNVCKAGDPEGILLKRYFEKFVTNVSKIYVDGKFEDIFDKDNNKNN